MPVVKAAKVGNEVLVRFLVTDFWSDLNNIRYEQSNLLNDCCGNPNISEETCILVAKTFPHLLKLEPGGTDRNLPPTVIFVRSSRKIPRYFMLNRDDLFDGAAAPSSFGCTAAYTPQTNWQGRLSGEGRSTVCR